MGSCILLPHASCACTKGRARGLCAAYPPVFLGSCLLFLDVKFRVLASHRLAPRAHPRLRLAVVAQGVLAVALHKLGRKLMPIIRHKGPHLDLQCGIPAP